MEGVVAVNIISQQQVDLHRNKKADTSVLEGGSMDEKQRLQAQRRACEVQKLKATGKMLEEKNHSPALSGQGGSMLSRIAVAKSRIAGFKCLFLMGVPILGLMLLAAKPAHASNTASANIILRCVATISVEISTRALISAATFYNFGDVPAASTRVATRPIGVRNNSQGAIVRYELDVVDISALGAQWTLGSTPGLNRAALYAKFSTRTISVGDFDVVRDTVPFHTQGAKTYRQDAAGNQFFDWVAAYTVPEWPYPDRVLPVSHDPNDGGVAHRHLWLRVDTPTAVESANQTVTMTLRITAK